MKPSSWDSSSASPVSCPSELLHSELPTARTFVRSLDFIADSEAQLSKDLQNVPQFSELYLPPWNEMNIFTTNCWGSFVKTWQFLWVKQIVVQYVIGLFNWARGLKASWWRFVLIGNVCGTVQSFLPYLCPLFLHPCLVLDCIWTGNAPPLNKLFADDMTISTIVIFLGKSFHALYIVETAYNKSLITGVK